MKKLIITLGVIASLVAAPMLSAPAALAATPAKAPQKVALTIAPVDNGYLVAWEKPKHAVKGLRYRITFQYEGSNLGIGYNFPVAKGANYFVLTAKQAQTTGGRLLAGKWLVSLRGYTPKQQFAVVGAKHFKIVQTCANTPVAGGSGLMHPMVCVLPPVM